MLNMKLVDKPIKLSVLEKMAKDRFGNLVKAVVDIEKEMMVVDAELHADEESHLLKIGSKQESLWGINLYPEKKGDDFIEFDSMINVRPSSDNLSRSIDDKKTREKIRKIVGKLVKK